MLSKERMSEVFSLGWCVYRLGKLVLNVAGDSWAGLSVLDEL